VGIAAIGVIIAAGPACSAGRRYDASICECEFAAARQGGGVASRQAKCAAAGSGARVSTSGERIAGRVKKNLTRRANHWHSAIIAIIFKSPRGEIRRGLFHWHFLNRTTAARHDAAFSPCTLLGVVSAPSSEPFRKICFLPARANVPARGVA
jgi:hypothetical protein